MKVIVLTGMDGTGKSTLLSQLEKHNSETLVLHVPHFHKTWDNSDFNDLSKSLLKLNELADSSHSGPLKIFAIFLSMLVYSKIEKKAKNVGYKILITERHPLTDVVPYGRIFNRYLDNAFIDKSNQLETFLQKTLNANEHKKTMKILNEFGFNSITNLFQFFVDNFKNIDSITPEFLMKTFNVTEPDKIIFLHARPEFLMMRIEQRMQKEVHENASDLNNLLNSYLHNMNTMNHIEIHKIDAESYNHLQIELLQKIKTMLL